MSQKIVVGPFNHGFRNDIPPFYVDNDSFPTLINAYQWRNRVKRKRGTTPISRLQRWFNSSVSSYGSTTSFNLSGGAGNLLTGFNLESTGNIVPGHVTFTDATAGNTYTDPLMDGTLQGSPAGSGTINYATGAITIVGGASDTINAATFSYYPSLPVMDIEDLSLSATQFPQCLAFDTVYSYQIQTASPYYSYDVSFYKNPASATYSGYTAKSTPTQVKWNGQNYQQFWSVSYENALWAVNGITVPFTTTNIGMQFKPIASIAYASATTLTITITEASATLIVGDFVFINEVLDSTLSPASYTNSVNWQSGYVTASSNSAGTTTITVKSPGANFANHTYSGGIIQYLTSNLAAPTKDGIRWYDGDPTNGAQFAPTLNGRKGWVNYAPPIYMAGSTTSPIGNLPYGIYYLVGARMIIPYKDRLLFLGAVVQCTGSISGQIAGTYYLQDTIVYSENGTPYYTASFQGSVLAPTSIVPILTPTIPQASSTFQGAFPAAYFSDVAGFGGFITAGYAQPITTVGYNQDVLIVGFTNRQTKLLYTGNDISPFSFYIINSELGATATFSGIVMDRGVIAIGDRGITITDQQSCQRIDLEILDYVFEFDLLNNGTQRITAQRDFVSEWIYFSFPYGTESDASVPFPNQTLLFNYRDNSWAVFNESYTTYGPFRRQTGFTWQTVGSYYSSWNAWNSPWNASSSSLEEPEVIAGNQQGFVVARGGSEDEATSEAPSLTITAYNTSTFTITSPNHGLNTGDFVFFLNAIGLSNFNSSPVASPPSYIIWQVTVVDVNNFVISSSPYTTPVVPTGTYVGNGTITRLYFPFIQTKQFPVAWGLGRKTRIGVQQYLLSTTPNSQITLLIYLSQNSSTPFNNPEYPSTVRVVPTSGSQNNSLIYSTILYTCQESTNLGLTPANINLQQIVPSQEQTWHRMNTSLIGDTVQIGFTLNDQQMFDPTLTYQIAEIELFGMIIDVSPSQTLS